MKIFLLMILASFNLSAETYLQLDGKQSIVKEQRSLSYLGIHYTKNYGFAIGGERFNNNENFDDYFYTEIHRTIGNPFGIKTSIGIGSNHTDGSNDTQIHLRLEYTWK